MLVSALIFVPDAPGQHAHARMSLGNVLRIPGLATILAVVFGVAAIGGIWITGMLVDRMLRRLTLAGLALFVVAGVILIASQGSTPPAILAVILWGLSFGGSATQLQTAARIFRLCPRR